MGNQRLLSANQKQLKFPEAIAGIDFDYTLAADACWCYFPIQNFELVDLQIITINKGQIRDKNSLNNNKK